MEKLFCQTQLLTGQPIGKAHFSENRLFLMAWLWLLAEKLAQKRTCAEKLGYKGNT